MYKTSDMCLAGTLITLGYIVEDIDRSNRKVIFSFQETPKLKKDIDRYWRDEILVEPIAFSNALKNLKTRIYDQN